MRKSRFTEDQMVRIEPGNGGCGYCWHRAPTSRLRNRSNGRMRIDENALGERQVRKPKGLRISVGDALGDDVFSQRPARTQEASTVCRAVAGSADPVARKMAGTLAGYETCRTFRPGRDGYTVGRPRGTGATGFVATTGQKA